MKSLVFKPERFGKYSFKSSSLFPLLKAMNKILIPSAKYCLNHTDQVLHAVPVNLYKYIPSLNLHLPQTTLPRQHRGRKQFPNQPLRHEMLVDQEDFSADTDPYGGLECYHGHH